MAVRRSKTFTEHPTRRRCDSTVRYGGSSGEPTPLGAAFQQALDENRTTGSELLSQVLARVVRVLNEQLLGKISGGDTCPRPERVAEPNYTRGFVVRQFE